jgi:cell division protein FtsB
MMSNSNIRNGNGWYDKLWYLRQRYFRIHDILNMSENQLRNSVLTYILMKEFGITKDISMEDLYNIKKKIEQENSSKAVKMKRLDIILTLIAIYSNDRREPLDRLMVMNELIDEGIVAYTIVNGVLKVDLEKTKENASKKKDELEREIIELKKKQLY